MGLAAQNVLLVESFVVGDGFGEALDGVGDALFEAAAPELGLLGLGLCGLGLGGAADLELGHGDSGAGKRRRRGGSRVLWDEVVV